MKFLIHRSRSNDIDPDTDRKQVVYACILIITSSLRLRSLKQFPGILTLPVPLSGRNITERTIIEMKS